MDSDSEGEKEEEMPKHTIRYKDIPLNLFQLIVKCIKILCYSFLL